MSFDDEWAQLKAATLEKQTAMRLNQLGGGGGGGAGGSNPDAVLTVEQSDLAAIGNSAFKLHQRLATDGTHAKASTEGAGTAMRQDFALGPALSTVAEKWGKQLGTLLDACGHISNHLEYSKKAHAEDEYVIATRFKYEQLNQGFEERAQH
ncbi:hypothetical protein ACIQ62_12125 [Streptomyces sp. NPDC096319]|uniref:hypothetical protein n=1 Tax=Streptomyces sp. NPDC096319 TaxID=3366084 RepID=UPI003819CE9C